MKSTEEVSLVLPKYMLCGGVFSHQEGSCCYGNI